MKKKLFEGTVFHQGKYTGDTMITGKIQWGVTANGKAKNANQTDEKAKSII